MKNTLASILLILLSCSLKAQDSCNCLLNFNHFVDKVSKNYAGYHDKVNVRTQTRYAALVDSLRQKAEIATSPQACYEAMEKYRLFFYDKHLQLSANLPAQNTEGAAPKPIQTDWNQASVMAYFDKNKGKLHALEGIWNTDGYKIALIQNAQSKVFEAVTLSAKNPNFKEGVLKFSSAFLKNDSYQCDYIMGNLRHDTVVMEHIKNIIAFDKFGIWKKQFPETKDTLTESQIRTRFGDVQWRVLDKNTLYIRLKNCNYANKPILDSIVKANATLLKTIPNWIVDFRGNTGGSTDVYQSLLPFAYTKPYVSRGSKHWMTPEHTQKFKDFFEKNKQYFDSLVYDYIQKLIVFGEKNPNGWYDDVSDTLKFDKPKTFPKRIAILSDRNNGSSGETFLIQMKGISDKVIVFGENSGGYLDYGDLQEFGFPCENYLVNIPSRRANYLDAGTSYDLSGYPPDVRIPENNKDWLQFVKGYWSKQKK